MGKKQKKNKKFAQSDLSKATGGSYTKTETELMNASQAKYLMQLATVDNSRIAHPLPEDPMVRRKI